MLEAWRIELLGGLSARNSEESITRFRTRQAGWLLAALALAPSQRPCFREALASDLWEGDDPDAARAKLRIALSSLRRQLEPPGTEPASVIFADRATIALQAGSFTLDAQEFERAADALLRLAPAETPLDRLEKTLALYQGDLLPDCYLHRMVGLRESLHQRYLHLLLRGSAVCELHRNIEAAIHYAERATRAAPQSEAPCLHLMNLLMRSGQASAAIRQYRALENRLRDTLGTTPSPELQQALLASSQRNALLRDPLPGANPPLCVTGESLPPVYGERKRDPARCRLPQSTTRFFGRTGEMQAIEGMLLSALQGEAGASPLLTLTGAGGCGKTRLATETARRLFSQYDVSVCFVALADAASSQQIPEFIARSLALPPSDENPIPRIQNALGEAPTLLLLDNFEQIVENCEGVFALLLRELPAVRFLVTSRQTLGLTCERLFPLAPLPLPDAALSAESLAALAAYPVVKLFLDRAQSIRPDFQLTEKNAATIVALCRKMEGMPLAIELTAAWAGALSPAQMLAKLTAHFDSLPSRKRDAFSHHKSLAAVIDWSYRLLTPETQRFFATLSVFRGGLTLEAAQAVCAENESALDRITGLRDHSLLACAIEMDADAPDETMRYRLLESLREFGQERLGPDERNALALRHALYFLAFAEAARANLSGAEQARWYRLLEREKPNCDAALDTLEAAPDQTEALLRMTDALHLFWHTRGYLSAGSYRLAAALARPDAADFPLALSGAVKAADILARARGDLEQAQEYGLRSLALARQIGDPLLVAKSLGGLGNTAKNQRDLVTARRYYDECLAIAGANGYAIIRATVIGNLANLDKEEKRFDSARTRYEASLALHRELENAVGQSTQLCNLAGLLGELGEYAAATERGAECLRLCRKTEDRMGIAYALEVLGSVFAAQKAPDLALRLFAAGEALREEIGMALVPAESEIRETVLAPIREALGEAAFLKNWREAKQEGVEAQIERFLEFFAKSP